MSSELNLYRISTNQGLSALWKHGLFWNFTAFYAGMLAPYNRSYHYFKVSRGFGEFQTQMSKFSSFRKNLWLV
jgi:hypothetical protein